VRKTLLLAVALTAGCGGAELRYAPAQPPFALSRERLAPIASVRFTDASGGMQSMGTGLMLKRHFYESFRDAMSVSLSSLDVSTGAASGADLEISLSEARLDRGQGLNADLTATVRYVVRVSRGGKPACEREGSGWTVLRESLVSSPDAKAVEVALTKAADGLGPTLASSCLYAAAPLKTTPTVPVAAAPYDVDVPPAPGRRDPHMLVLAFGAERYRGGAPARFAGADARAFAAYAEAALGASDERVVLAVDEDATYASLRKYVDGWIPNRLGVDDAVIVYFAGRGATEGATGKAYLAPTDADPSYLAQTAYSTTELLAALGRLPAKVTLILDAGFSGAGPRSMTPPGAKAFAVDPAVRIPANVTVVSAARADESVNDVSARGHGLFTYELLKALRDAPALHPAFEAAKIEVALSARRDWNAEQTPQWSSK
jgi:hypothetical protein